MKPRYTSISDDVAVGEEYGVQIDVFRVADRLEHAFELGLGRRPRRRLRGEWSCARGDGEQEHDRVTHGVSSG